MSQFRFRLETLLRLKIAARDERRAELAEVLRAEEQLREQQAEVDQAIEDQHEYIRQTTKSGQLDLDLVTASQREVSYLSQVAIEKQSLLTQLTPHIQQRRQALVDADHEVRVMEKLKEKQLQQHLDKELAAEAKQMDEVALTNYQRKGESPWQR